MPGSVAVRSSRLRYVIKVNSVPEREDCKRKVQTELPSTPVRSLPSGAAGADGIHNLVGVTSGTRTRRHEAGDSQRCTRVLVWKSRLEI